MIPTPFMVLAARFAPLFALIGAALTATLALLAIGKSKGKSEAQAAAQANVINAATERTHAEALASRTPSPADELRRSWSRPR